MNGGVPDLLPTIFRNSFWSALACVAAPVIAFLFGGLTVRYVGIEAAGFSTAVGAMLAIAGQFGSLGIGEAIVPALGAALGAGDRPRVRRLIGLAFLFAIASSCLASIGLVLCTGAVIAWTRTKLPTEAAASFIMITAGTAIVTALTGGLTCILRSASRHDLVTKVTVPLAILRGVVGCVLVPLFPSLRTVAMINAFSALCDLPVMFVLARRIVPETVRPSVSLAELPRLARYGLWTSLTKLVSVMTGGVDDLVITGTCGAAALPPWTICKRLWLTMHTFLAQHVEHLIPTLGGVRETSRQVFESIGAGMHWYVVVVAAAGYTFLSWAGPPVIAAVAGDEVAALCAWPLFSFSLAGVFWSLSVMPVISALAASAASPGFIVALCSNTVQLATVVVLARSQGTPAVYLAPLAVIPIVVATLGTSPARLFEPGLAWRRIRPTLVPLAFGVVGVLSGLAPGEGRTFLERTLGGAAMATAVGVLTLVTEDALGINAQAHGQFVRAMRHGLGIARGFLRSFRVVRQRSAAKP